MDANEAKELHPVTFFDRDETPQGVRDFRPRVVPQDVVEEEPPPTPVPDEDTPELSRAARGAGKA